jgi:hypothetical protein
MSNKDPMGQDEQKRRSIGSRIRKVALLSVLPAGLLAGNVASIVSVSAHEWMHSALWSVLAIGGQTFADHSLRNSPKAKLDATVKARTVDLEIKNKQLAEAHRLQTRRLDELGVRNKQLVHQLDVNGKQAKATVAAVGKRLTKGISRNMAALPSEAVPYLGVGITVAVTTLDIYDACQTMKDFNSLLRMMGQGEENPDLCGQKVPTVEQVLASTRTEWRTSVQQIANEAKAFKVSAPDARLPTRDEVRKASCSAASVPYLCTER